MTQNTRQNHQIQINMITFSDHDNSNSEFCLVLKLLGILCLVTNTYIMVILILILILVLVWQIQRIHLRLIMIDKCLNFLSQNFVPQISAQIGGYGR